MAAPLPPRALIVLAACNHPMHGRLHDHLLVAVPVDLMGKTGGVQGHGELLSSLLLFCLSFFLVFFRTLLFLFVLLSCARASLVHVLPLCSQLD